MSHTFAILEISEAAYREIRARLVKAGPPYDALFSHDGPDEVIDMHGIAVKVEREKKDA